MLALLGALTIVLLVAAVVLDWLSPVVALIAIPAAAALLGGFGWSTATFMISGITAIAPVVAMFVFAILFFGVLTDAGLLAPLVRAIVRVAAGSPRRIAVATALLALLVHLDGSGAVCFLVAIPALLPLYDELGMDRRVLACLASLSAGVNFLPWTGPTLRAAAALHTTPTAIFQPMIGVQAAGLGFVFGAALVLGGREARRLAAQPQPAAGAPVEAAVGNPPTAPRLDWRFWPNAALAVVTLGAIISGAAPPASTFMLATAVALALNHPKPDQQRALLETHGRPAIAMACALLGAGAFAGVMGGTGMTKAMAQVVSAHVSHAAAAHLPFGLSLVAMPLSLMFDPDSFYFGVLPVLGQVYQGAGGDPLRVAQAALVGQMTTGFPISPLTPATFLVAGLSRVGLAEHQRFAFPLLYAASLVMAIACVAFGLFPL